MLGRGDPGPAADRLGAASLGWEEPLPEADLLVVAVRDDAIEQVAERLGPRTGRVAAAVHLSGLKSVTALDALEVPTGSFHPLQTLPDPEMGAERLAGAWIAVTSDDDYLADRLFAFAASLGSKPFELRDEQKALYHAAAAAAANTPLAAMAMSEHLFRAAGVDPVVAEPLVRAVIDNGLSIGPEAALTGPAARGDVGTVAAQIRAVQEAAPELAEDFVAYVRAIARVAGTLDVIEEVLP